MPSEPASVVFVQEGTGQIAILSFDVDTGEWVVNMFRHPASSVARMGSWPTREAALTALARLQFAIKENSDPGGPEGPTR